jgi:hypothetical protein
MPFDILDAFGLSKGARTSKSTSTNNKTFTTTTTPTVPEWASGLVQKGAARVGQVADLNPYDLVAPADALQARAGAAAAGLTGTPWNYDLGADLTRGAANTSWLDPYMASDTPFASGGKAFDYIDKYQNPFLHDVVDSSAADLDANAGSVRAQQALDLAGSGAFGGSGAALTQSMTEGELARARASTLSGLRSQAFQTALAAAAGDADRATQARVANAQLALQDRGQKVGFGFQGQQQQLDAGKQLSDLSSSFGANERANIATQAGIGDTLRNIYQQQLQAPVTSAQQITAMLSGLPISLFAGQQTTGIETSTTKGTQTGSSLDAAISGAKAFAPGGFKS